MVYIHSMLAETIDLDDTPNCVCFGLRRAARTMTQFYSRNVEGGGVRATQTPILTVLSLKPQWEMAELSETLGLERTTLIRNLGPLKRDGLVTISTKKGRRAAVVEITDKGREGRQAVLPAWRKAQRRAVAVLGADRWAQILSDLRRVSDALGGAAA